MRVEVRLTACFTAGVMAAIVSMTSSEIFTSMLKVERMVFEEEQLLGGLKQYIDLQYDKLKALSNFYSNRLHDVRLLQKSDLDLRHPNSVYKVIKRFAVDYADVLGDNFENFRAIAKNSQGQLLADGDDIEGARLSLLRLQNVYNMNALVMAKGDYLGYLGPQLDHVDAYEIGKTAFTNGKLNESLEWLNVSLTLYAHKDALTTETSESGFTVGAIKALIGRVHLFNGSPHLAEALYEEAKLLDPLAGDVVTLETELQTQPRAEHHPDHDYFYNFSRLCSLEKRHYAAEPNSPRTVCRYREAVLPYYRFQEEILSISPFASVIYNVISDREGDNMKDFVKNQLVRGEIGGDNSIVSDVRTSNTAWIYDAESTVASSVAKRIQCITGLDISQRSPDGPDSSEPFQVVNYGLGGHYEVHMDPFESNSTPTKYIQSGERIATFLIYLSDVERGGATVFTQVDVSVAPTKNMALLWYSFNPAHQRDDLTHHAGCPVLIGQKWIANKWIWTYGNTFQRRCGLKPDATQVDIEPDMRRGYR